MGPKELENQVAVVTGGGRGIGLAIANALADAGARVAVVDVDESGAREAAESLPGEGHLGFRADVTLDVVLRYLRIHGNIPEMTDSLFVVDRAGKYRGMLPLVSLLTNAPDTLVATVMERDIHGIPADLPDVEVARLFEDRDLISAPVISETGMLLGRITIDDVVDVIREDADHSLLSMAGLDEEDDTFAPVIRSAGRRAVWLGINLGTAFLASWVIGLFQATLQQVVALAVLMPIVASMGGISGSQTLIIVIRGMALGQIEKSNARWMLVKEIAIGTLNGFAWALVVAGVTVIWWGTWDIAAVIANGVSPCISNLMGVHVARQLEKVEQLQLGRADAYNFQSGRELTPRQWLKDPKESLATLDDYRPWFTWLLQMVQENGIRIDVVPFLRLRPIFLFRGYARR